MHLVDEAASGVVLPRGVRQAWGLEPEAGKPGPKATLTIAGIATSATALADAEGLKALSLGRVAERLGVTTNALYRYVDSRDDLDVIVHDHALGRPSGIVRAGEWSEAAALWARALRQRYARHAWLSDMRVRVPFAPNAMAWLDDLLARLEASGLSEREMLRAAGLLDGYVRARAGAARDLDQPDGASVSSTTMLEAVGRERFTARLPRVASLVAAGFYNADIGVLDDDFEFGLRCILSGLQQFAQVSSPR